MKNIKMLSECWLHIQFWMLPSPLKLQMMKNSTLLLQELLLQSHYCWNAGKNIFIYSEFLNQDKNNFESMVYLFVCFERCFISNKVMEIHIMNIFLIYTDSSCRTKTIFYNIILGDRFALYQNRFKISKNSANVNVDLN